MAVSVDERCRCEVGADGDEPVVVGRAGVGEVPDARSGVDRSRAAAIRHRRRHCPPSNHIDEPRTARRDGMRCRGGIANRWFNQAMQERSRKIWKPGKNAVFLDFGRYRRIRGVARATTTSSRPGGLEVATTPASRTRFVELVCLLRPRDSDGDRTNARRRRADRPRGARPANKHASPRLRRG